MVKLMPPLYHEVKQPKRDNRANADQRGYDYRWKKYRLRYLQANPWCQIHLTELNIYVVATIVDHIKAHKGDKQLFWDPSNHRALCKTCHDRFGAK